MFKNTFPSGIILSVDLYSTYNQLQYDIHIEINSERELNFLNDELALHHNKIFELTAIPSPSSDEFFEFLGLDENGSDYDLLKETDYFNKYLLPAINSEIQKQEKIRIYNLTPDLLSIAELKKLNGASIEATVQVQTDNPLSINFKNDKFTISVVLAGKLFNIREARTSDIRLYTTLTAASNALFKCGIERFYVERVATALRCPNCGTQDITYVESNVEYYEVGGQMVSEDEPEHYYCNKCEDVCT